MAKRWLNCALLGYYAADRSMAKRWLNSKPHFYLRCLPTLAEEVCGHKTTKDLWTL